MKPLIFARIRRPPAVGSRGVRLAGLAVAAALALAIGGCAGSRVPSVSKHRATDRTESAAALSARSCVPSQLHVRAGREGVNETAHGDIELTNAGAAACTLRGLPRIALIRRGRRLAVRPTRAPDLQLVPALLAPGQTADLAMSWTNWCGSRTPQLSVQVTFSGGGTITAPFNGPPDWDYVPQCVDARYPSTISVVQAYLRP
jgi:Protein of unknown function (DUF4232)